MCVVCVTQRYNTSLSIDRFPALVKVHGVQLKASGTLLKLRLYQAFSLMSPAIFEGQGKGRRGWSRKEG